MSANLITALAVSAAYLASRKARGQPLLRQATALGIWLAYLSSIELDSNAYYTQTKMIESVLCFIMPLKLSQLILFDEGPREQVPGWKDLLSFVGSFFYYALPISKSKRNEPPATLLARNTADLLTIACKLISLLVLVGISRQLLNENPGAHDDPTNVVYWQLLASFSATVIMGTWGMDLQCIVVNLVTLGRYEMLPMHNYPLLAVSVGELWAKRYNLLIHTLLKECVYIPLRKSNYSSTVGSLGAFVVSGILHSWVAYYTFGRGIVRACIFFLVQVPWIALEQLTNAGDPEKDKIPSTFLRRLITFTFFFGSLPIYAGLFVEGYPQWLEKNDSGVPSQLSVFSDIANWIMAQLGIKAEHWA